MMAHPYLYPLMPTNAGGREGGREGRGGWEGRLYTLVAFRRREPRGKQKNTVAQHGNAYLVHRGLGGVQLVTGWERQLE